MHAVRGHQYLADYRSTDWRITDQRIGGSRNTQDELYFKHLGKRLNCSYTKNKLYMKCTLSVGRKTEEISINAQRN